MIVKIEREDGGVICFPVRYFRMRPNRKVSYTSADGGPGGTITPEEVSNATSVRVYFDNGAFCHSVKG